LGALKSAGFGAASALLSGTGALDSDLAGALTGAGLVNDRVEAGLAPGALCGGLVGPAARSNGRHKINHPAALIFMARNNHAAARGATEPERKPVWRVMK
jgi:hypothetical protein